MSVEVASSSMMRQGTAAETAPFVLRSLLDDVPLSAEGDRHDIEINCVEFLDQNLYIGTSASEILHFVQIPPDPDDLSAVPSYILASRLPPPYANPPTSERPGVQQILLLPSVSKACVLCNWTVTFYSLPELSPVFGDKRVSGSNWIGGLDLNVGKEEKTGKASTVLLSLNKRIRVVRVGDDLKVPNSITFAGSSITVRRDNFACVADSRSYALLDVNRLLKIPLFPISSLDDSHSETVGGKVEDISESTGTGVQRSASTAHRGQSTAQPEDRGHGRSTSLGTFMSGPSRPSQQSGRDTPGSLFRDASPAAAISPARHGRDEDSPEKPLPAPPPARDQEPSSTITPHAYLKPRIISPSPQEFLLVTGTGTSDPGVGIFVNLEGDVTRSTLEFDRYPDGLVADGRGVGIDLSANNADDEEEGYILASMRRDIHGEVQHGLEIQRWDIDPGDGDSHKYWLQVSVPELMAGMDHPGPGIRSVTDTASITFDNVVDKLRVRRFRPSEQKSINASTISLQSTDSRTASSLEQVAKEKELFESQDTISEEALPTGWEQRREDEELQFAKRLGLSHSRIAVWSGDRIWWVVRNPLASRLDAMLDQSAMNSSGTQTVMDSANVIRTINSLRGREAKTEIEYMSLGYIRQRAGLLLFKHLLSTTTTLTEAEYRGTEEALLEGGLDPRVVMALVPVLRDEVIEGRIGIWIPGGVKQVAEEYISSRDAAATSDLNDNHIGEHILQFFRSFLTAWRKKKGFGSIANEKEVFRSVDAGLLVVLLHLDKSTRKGIAKLSSARSELNELVDHGVDCFDRAVHILQSYHRLYVLSRLYQSQKMASEVLSTWRRIIEGELDEGGEFSGGEQRVREYLMIVRNQSLVQEYGVWLAGRNPTLGVLVFAEDRSKVKFEPTEVVEILRRGAPGAVKEYLEHLVFGKNHTEYVNELIAYYLDIVLQRLEDSNDARTMLAQSYESYRALRPPKPTYRQFITDNAIEEEWWHSRLRLLQLLGGSHASASEYDVETILARIQPFTQELVPEVIILDGRQSRHQEALKLLIHGLGDYDTAINYCLLGGSSIYHPISGQRSLDSLPSREEQAKLLGYLLAEFLQIEDISNRVEQTGILLERFGGWFDIGYVLGLIPDTWSVELVSGFLISALRRIVSERSETMIAKALSGAENLKITADVINRIEEIGASIEDQR